MRRLEGIENGGANEQIEDVEGDEAQQMAVGCLHALSVMIIRICDTNLSEKEMRTLESQMEIGTPFLTEMPRERVGATKSIFAGNSFLISVYFDGNYALVGSKLWSCVRAGTLPGD